MNRYEKAALAIIARQGAKKLKPYEPSVPKVEPEPEPLPTTVAGAYARGYSDASEVAGSCCGCNTYPEGATNPYDGTTL